MRSWAKAQPRGINFQSEEERYRSHQVINLMTPIPLEPLCITFLRCAKQHTQIILLPIQNTGNLYRLASNTVE